MTWPDKLILCGCSINVSFTGFGGFSAAGTGADASEAAGADRFLVSSFGSSPILFFLEITGFSTVFFLASEAYFFSGTLGSMALCSPLRERTYRSLEIRVPALLL